MTRSWTAGPSGPISGLVRLACMLWVLLAAAAPAQAQGLSGFVSPGELAAAHEEVEGLLLCTSCHEPGAGIGADRCMACHEEVKRDVAANKGFHANKGTGCETCHPDHKGRGFEMVRFDEETFPHDDLFPLRGEHAKAECLDCHQETTWQGLDSDCLTCHNDIHGATASERSVLSSCELCHDDGGWEAELIPAIFDHTDSAQTDFPLIGGHLDPSCAECHVDALFVPTAHERCTACHDDPHRELENRCESCHDTDNWRVDRFDHQLTGYVLQGVHAEVGCTDCHGANKVRRKAHDTCADCHDDVHNGQFDPQPCSSCHSQEEPGWVVVDFDHDATDFPLLGEHVEVACEACHGEGPDAEFADLAHDDCDACHTDPHEERFEPTACATCHQEQGWQVDDFDHDRTDFPLVGSHQQAACDDCHGDGVYTGLRHDFCSDCHEDDPHDELGTRSCAECHTPTEWPSIEFNHLVTQFDLAPRHVSVPCDSCHELVRFDGLQMECVGCHQTDEPRWHYPGACDSCHAGAHWTPAGLGELDHSVTGFALRGTHGQLACEDCHSAGEPRGLAQAGCVSCHAADDVHRNLLGDVCDDCHSETSWVRTRFRHQQTGWPLRGAHRLAPCVDCHATGYVGTPTACVQCHERDASLDVAAHQSPELPLCDSCHRPYTWASARFAH